MQNSIWKLVTAAGIVGIGTLVVLEVQNQLAGGVHAPVPGTGPAAQVDSDTSASGALVGEVDMSPDPTTEFDLLFQDLTDPESNDTSTVVANHSGQTSSGGIDTRVSRQNLGGDESPFAAYDGEPGVRTAAASGQPDSRDVRPAGHTQESGFFSEDSTEPSEDDTPVFSLADAPGMTQSQPGESQETGDGAPFFQDDAPPQNEATTSQEPPADFGVGEFFANDSDSEPEQPSNFDPRSDSNASGAGTESGGSDIFVPFAFDEPDPATGGSGESPAEFSDSPNTPVDWPPSGNGPLLPEPNPSGTDSTRQRLPASGNSEPFNNDEDPEFFPLGSADPEPEGSFFTEDPPSESMAVPSLNFDRDSTDAPFGQDRNNEFDDRDFDAISNSRELNENSRSVPVRRSPATDFDNEPLLPVAPTPLTRNDIPPLNRTPGASDTEAFPDPREFSGDGLSTGTLPGLSGSADVRPVSGTMSSVMRPHLSIQKEAPETATVGVPLEYTITVQNDGQSIATDVVVEDALPAAADLETAHPVPDYDRETRRLRWQLDQLGPGETQTISVRIVPNGEGTLDGVATVRFKAYVQSTTRITAPKLRLSMNGPSRVRLGDTVAFTFVLSNEGTGDASDVVLRNILPSGLQHPEGSDLEYEISSLASGERQEVTLDVVAAEPGEFKNAAEVTSAGVATDSTSVPITIVGAQLTVERLGPQRRYVGRTAQFQNIITNDTVFDAMNAVVVERIPEGFRFVSASSGGEYNPAERLITWRLPRIPSGEQVLLDVDLSAERTGEMDTIVEVVEEGGFRTRATKTVAIEDIHNVSADISRLSGPIAVGEKFGFSIVVDNRGTAVARNVQLNVQVPQQIKVLAAGSNEMTASRTAENVVHYATVLEVGPGEQTVYRLSLQGDLPVQNALVKAHLKYDGMDQPLVVSESVTVYSDSL